MLALLPAILVLLHITETQSISVEFTTSPSEGLNPGPAENVILSCEWVGDFNTETDDVHIVRNNQDGTSTLLASKSGIHPNNIYDHMLFLRWYEDVHSLWIVLRGFSRQDYGTYTCYAMHKEYNDIQALAEQTILVNILYPQSGEPDCFATPNTTVVYDGDEVTLHCVSDAGNPSVSLQWDQTNGTSLSRTLAIQKPNKILDGIVTFNIDASHRDVVFSCIRTNNNLSDTNTSFCSIGPFKVLDKTFMSLDNPVVIAGITIIPIVILVTTICTALLLVRSGRCAASSKRDGCESDSVVKSDIKTDSTSKDGDHVNNNPKEPPKIVIQNGAAYTAIQKERLTRSKTAPVGKSYPKPPSYPRPPKLPDAEDGNQYANSHKVSEVNETAQYANSRESTRSNENTQYANPLHVNKNGLKSQNSVYSNSVDVIPNATDAEKIGDGSTKLYANASGSPRVPAPNQTPPPPPTEVVEYADIDIIKPASNCMANVAASEPVVYASVK